MVLDLFAEKIKQLNHDKLKELLQFKNTRNAHVIEFG